MEELLRNDTGSEDRFKLLSEATFEGICIHDQGIILDTNQQFADMFGYTVDELKGMDCLNLNAPQSLEVVREYIATGFIGPYESYGQRKDDSIFPVEVRARKLQQDGKTLRLAVLRDLSDQKELERKIAESEKKYRELYNASPISLYRTRISDGKLFECNQALAELFGYDSKEDFQATSNAVDRYVDINDRALLLEKLEKEKRIEGFQVQVKRKDDQVLWIEVTAEIFPEQGCFEGAVQDITASKVLTKTERIVLRQIVEGKTNSEIAYASDRSVRTIEDHRSGIMKRLRADNLPDLVCKAQSLRPESEE